MKLVARTLEHFVVKAVISLIDGNDFMEISLTLLDGDNENDDVWAMLASATTRTADFRPDILLNYLYFAELLACKPCLLLQSLACWRSNAKWNVDERKMTTDVIETGVMTS